MKDQQDIRDLSREEIEEKKWNAVCRRSGLPYGQTWWLDIVAEGWHGLVEGDYEAVMPYWVKKAGVVRYIMQPPLTQQLGVFGETKDEAAFYEKLPCRSFVMQTNEKNEAGKYSREARRNRILSLTERYETIARGYSENARRNIRKAKSNDVRVEEGKDEKKSFQFYQQENDHVANERETRLLANHIVKEGKGKWIVARSGEGEVLSEVLLVDSGEGRLLYLIAATSGTGKRMGASAAVVDWIVRKYAGSGRELDFEGSMSAGVDRFYASFGAEERTYHEVARCHPKWLGVAKRAVEGWIRKFR